MASLLLKVPTGTLTALAAMLMLDAFITGPELMSVGDSRPVAYAFVFGAAQQGFTGLVGRQAQNALNSVSSKSNSVLSKRQRVRSRPQGKRDARPKESSTALLMNSRGQRWDY
jgi:hypothetical protein